MSNTEPNREFTFGEKLVGLSFNPSSDPRVDELKELAARMADIVNEVVPSNDIQAMVKQSAIQEILNAQMNAVKVLFL